MVIKSFSATIILLLSIMLFACGPLGPFRQKTVQNNNNYSYNLDVISPWIETQERVPYYKTLYFSDGQGYEFKNASSNKLIIYLNGYDWFGARVDYIGDKLSWNASVNWFLPLYSEYSIFVPEKFDWGREKKPFWKIENREKYTFDNLIANYTSVIKEYLSQNDYKTVIIIGHSEGGLIAPELYFQLEDFTFSAIISSGAGGLMSPVDISAARRGEPLDDESINRYLETYNQFLATYSGERYAEAPDEVRFRRTGKVFVPLIYSYSQQARRPFEYYKNINIPVLFIHGLLDVYVSPISTKYVEENLPDKPFDYIYYPDTQHFPTTVRELEKMRADIAAWLKEKGI